MNQDQRLFFKTQCDATMWGGYYSSHMAADCCGKITAVELDFKDCMKYEFLCKYHADVYSDQLNKTMHSIVAKVLG